MSEAYSFWVRGTPKAQPRPRMTKSGHAYTPPSADEWKEEIAWQAKAERIPRMHRGVNVDVVFYFPRPKSMKMDGKLLTHKKKPDIDNLCKAVYDALTDAGVWDDDSQIVQATARKYYEYDRKPVGAIITIFEEEEDPRCL